MTFMPEGSNRRVNRAWQMPRSYEEMVQRRKALQAWARLSWRLYGAFAGSRRLRPDRPAHEDRGSFRKHGPDRAKALIDYVDYAPRTTSSSTYVIINPQAERAKDWSAQADDLCPPASSMKIPPASTIRGAKMLGTSSIMANEVLVANLQRSSRGKKTSPSPVHCR